MNPPDWQHCTEDELWRYVAWHLEGAGIRSVLVGGAVVAIYTEGIYRSGDLDLIPDELQRKRLAEVLAGLGFQPTKGRYFKHPQCEHLFLEFPRGPVELGEQYPVVPEQVEVAGRKLGILSPTDCVKDRLAGYIHWGVRTCFDQAVLVCRRQSARINFAELRQWCEREGGTKAFERLLASLQDQPEHPE